MSNKRKPKKTKSVAIKEPREPKPPLKEVPYIRKVVDYGEEGKLSRLIEVLGGLMEQIGDVDVYGDKNYLEIETMGPNPNLETDELNYRKAMSRYEAKKEEWDEHQRIKKLREITRLLHKKEQIEAKLSVLSGSHKTGMDNGVQTVTDDLSHENVS